MCEDIKLKTKQGRRYYESFKDQNCHIRYISSFDGNYIFNSCDIVCCK